MLGKRFGDCWIGGLEGQSAMEYLSCYDPSGIEFAWSIFLNITAVSMILAAVAATRLIVLSHARSVEQLQTA